MNKLYKIPLFKRFCEITSESVATKVKIMHIDQLGLYVYYDKTQEDQLKPDFIRRHLIGMTSTYAIIEAENSENALEIFFNEWEGALVGGENESTKALWIDQKQPIKELPSCQLLHRTKDKRFTCGEVNDETNSGEYGMCVIAHYDRPDFECPIDDFYGRAWELPEETFNFKGKKYKIIRDKVLEV